MIEVNVIGVRMNTFAKLDASEDYPEMARIAITIVMNDTGSNYRESEGAYAGFVYGVSFCGYLLR